MMTFKEFSKCENDRIYKINHLISEEYQSNKKNKSMKFRREYEAFNSRNIRLKKLAKEVKNSQLN